MNKTQRNRKLVKQNQRNRVLNRRYSSTVKNLIKLFKAKVKIYQNFEVSNVKESDLEKFKKDLIILRDNLYSIIDKATKKKVIHKNTANRKKSRLHSMLS